ncbi:expressed unknown protein [Seminavis robusta]|uniref:A20-type domain-containing protein n=1 Tax=Seminavis robusta TaxID=568900 RepID=A0A9N8E4K8_9STRA|nr:expressed unknown protein [Seminavis robusta]|eukprot:Sro494_g154350.1 n/a (148) ;mRNA; r:55434-56322
MSNQSQTTSETPAENILCKMGCGFFGNNATGDCCSKCWRSLQKNKDGNLAAPVCAPVAAPQPIAPIPEEEEPTPMDVDICPPAVEAPAEVKPAPAATTPKKKKKKASYKNMMKGMMMSNSPQKDIEQEKESLRKVTGGGTFSKIEKI